MHYQTDEDSYSAFKDMLRGEPVIRILFQYGLLEESWFSCHWKQYRQETNSTPVIVSTKEGKPVVERINEKMKEIFVRRNKSDFYMERLP